MPSVARSRYLDCPEKNLLISSGIINLNLKCDNILVIEINLTIVILFTLSNHATDQATPENRAISSY